MNIAHSLLVSQTHLYIFLSETHCTWIEARIESRKIKPILQLRNVLSHNEQ